jgi:hypothetical protein
VQASSRGPAASSDGRGDSDTEEDNYGKFKKRPPPADGQGGSQGAPNMGGMSSRRGPKKPLSQPKYKTLQVRPSFRVVYVPRQE